MSINNYKMLIFHSFKASGSTFSHLHQILLKSFKEAASPQIPMGGTLYSESITTEPPPQGVGVANASNQHQTLPIDAAVV